MKHSFFRIIALCVGFLPSTGAMCQDGHAFSGLKADTISGVRNQKMKDDLFFGVSAGFNGAWGENIRFTPFSDYLKSQRFGVMISAGKYFTPVIGVRGSLGYYRQCGRAEKEPREVYPDYYGDGFYDFRNLNGYADVLVDMKNLFSSRHEDDRFRLTSLFGIGFNTTFGFDETKVERFAAPPAPYIIRDKADLYFAIRAGLMLTYRLSDKFDLDFEVQMNATDDRYNGVNHDRIYDGYLATMIGVRYKINRTLHSKRLVVMTDAAEVEKVNARFVAAQNDLEKALALPPDTVFNVNREQFLEMTVSFVIDKFNITDVQRPNVEAVAAYINSHPEVDVVICGFADVNTAYPAYNMRLSKRRVMAVYNMLTQQFGVDPQRLSIDYKGDTEQPYDLKYQWNRVVVFKLTPHNEYIDK